MSSQLFPKKNAEFIFYVGLPSVADGNIFQSNPTLAAGDVKVSIDGGALANLNTLPDVDPDNSKAVKVLLSSSEMNGDNIQVIFSDAAGGEWKDVFVNIQTADRQVNDLAFPVVSGRGIDVEADGSLTAVMLAEELGATALADIETALATVLTATVADAVPADGTRPSIASGILMLTRFLMERAVVGTTMTVKKEDGATASMTFTLNSATDPTAITRAT